MYTSPDMLMLFREVRSRRHSENIVNAVKFIGIVCLALLIAAITMIAAEPERSGDTLTSLATSAAFAFGLALVCVFLAVILFWPLLLYLLANVARIRQQTLLALIQTAVETGKPLQDILCAHASSCSAGYAARLQRFALALDSGWSLEDAVREHRGLFRYDVAAIIRLGGDAPEILRSLETVAQDERNYSPILFCTIMRVVYLCILVFKMQFIMLFMFIRIVPEFEKIFMDFNTNLPNVTNSIILVSQSFAAYWYLGAPLFPLLALIAVVYMILQTNVVVVRPPGFRRIFCCTDAAKFLRVFAAGVQHRFPIPAILDMYRWVVPSEYLRSRGTQIQESVERGGDWIDAACRMGFINQPEAALLYSAERTGNTAAILDQLAQSKERSQIRRDDLVSKLVFITLIFLLAAFIGTFVVGMFLPSIELIHSLT